MNEIVGPVAKRSIPAIVTHMLSLKASTAIPTKVVIRPLSNNILARTRSPISDDRKKPINCPE